MDKHIPYKDLKNYIGTEVMVWSPSNSMGSIGVIKKVEFNKYAISVYLNPEVMLGNITSEELYAPYSIHYDSDIWISSDHKLIEDYKVKCL